MPSPQEVLEFWFGAQTDPVAVGAAKSKLWWGKSAETDREIVEQFGSSLVRAAKGELDPWAQSASGTVALIIVLDQFSRVIHRDTAGMFANDARAQTLTRRLIDSGSDADVPPIHRVFAYMPLMHAETVALQDEGVELFRRLAEQAPEPERGLFRDFHGFAVRHRDIVARFCRFPHRNRVLGRASTPEELAFLEQPNSSF